MGAWTGIVSAFVLFIVGVVAAVLLVLDSDGGLLWIGGVLFLLLAVWLFLWNFEKDALFADDWVEVAQAAGCLVCVVAGVGLLIGYALVS